MPGYVYILTNPDIPGLVKVGYTTKHPEQRALELAGTGVPRRFVVDYSLKVANPEKVEILTHQQLASFHHSKEWFRCDVITAKTIIENIVGNKTMFAQMVEDINAEKLLYDKYYIHFEREFKYFEGKVESSIWRWNSNTLENIRKTIPKKGFLGLFGDDQYQTHPTYLKAKALVETDIILAREFLRLHLIPCSSKQFKELQGLETIKSEIVKKQIVKGWQRRRDCLFTWEHMALFLSDKSNPIIYKNNSLKFPESIHVPIARVIQEAYRNVNKNKNWSIYI